MTKRQLNQEEEEEEREQQKKQPRKRQRQHSQRVDFSRHETNPQDATGGASCSTTLATTFHTDEEASQAHELDLRQKERVSMQRIFGGLQRQHLTESTGKIYNRCQDIFSEWCLKAGYRDNNAIMEKVVRFFECLTALKEDPDNNNSDSDGNDIDDGDSADNDTNECPPSSSMVKIYVSAIDELYHQQLADPNNTKIFNYHERTPADYLKGPVRDYESRMGKMNRARGTNDGTAGFVEIDPLAKNKMIMVYLWHHNLQGERRKSTRVITGLCHRLDSAFRFFMMCRSKTTREAKIVDLFGQNVAPPGRGGKDRSFVLGVVLMSRQEKGSKDGRIRYKVVVRNSDVEACPVGALAFYLLEYWLPTSSSSAPPPDLNDFNWVNYYLLSKATKRDSKLSYSSQYYQARKVLNDLNEGTEGTVTHLGRRLGASLARLCGATHEDISKHGGWATNRLITHYLDGVDASIAFQMAGFESGHNFWLRRNVIPDLELQRMVFPFIEGACSDPKDKEHYDLHWIQTVNNIMLDKDIYHGRQEKQNVKEANGKTARNNVSKETVLRRRFLILLAHLRKVILQDAAVMLLKKETASQHPIFKRKVFKSTEFETFLESMQKTLDDVSLCPPDMSPVAPVIQQRMETTNVLISQRISRLTTDMSWILDAVRGQNVNHDRLVLQTEKLSQLVANGFTQGFGQMNTKFETMMSSLTTLLPSAANRVTTTTQAQVQGGSSVTGSSSSAHPVSIDSPRGIDRDNNSITSKGKILRVAAAIARDRQEKGEAAVAQPERMPFCTLVPRPNTLEEIWQEWFYGFNGNPSIVQMEEWYFKRWRSEKNSTGGKTKGYAGLYLFKRTMIDSVLRYIPDDGPIEMVMIEQALQDFKQMLWDDYNTCSIATYYKNMPKGVSRKFKGKE